MTTAIIVNADDTGRSIEVNDCVFNLMERGRITSATVVAGGEAMEDVAARYGSYPRCSFGVHMYLEDFPPITPTLMATCLVEPNGCFKHDVRTHRFTPDLKRAIAEEWIAQIRCLQSAGIPVSHIDSHNHVHTIPSLFHVFKHVQRSTGIRKARISLNCYAEPVSRIHLLKKMLFNFGLRHYFPTTTTTTHFAKFSIFNTLLKSGRLPRTATIELMVHPGAATYMKSPADYQEELMHLDQDWTKQLPWDYKFISYDEL